MKPNILHIFTDQQRFDTIAALGNPVIKTPNIDRLVKSGVSFTNAFTPSPVCVAARCSMIYSQYPTRTDCWDNGTMPDGRDSFMDALTQAGYRTYGIGKCHFTPDPLALRGFQSREIQEELPAERTPYTESLIASGFDHCYEAHGVRGEMYYIPQPSRLPARLHPTQWIGDRSVDFIRENQDKEEPWYLFSSFIHPHPPFSPPVPWHKLYRAALMPLPNVPQDVASLQMFANHVQNRYKYRDQGIDTNLLRNMKAYYYSCISFIDYQVGKILDALEETGQLKNTMILFTADHGEHLGDYNCFGKRTMQDSCARIPMMVSLPGVFDSGKTCDIPVSLVDVAPTFLAQAGTGIGTHTMDGMDMAALASGGETRNEVFSFNSAHDVLVHTQLAELPDECRDFPKQACASYMIVTDRYKYVYSAADTKELLFDKKLDPAETRNRAGLVFYRDIQKSLKQRLIERLRKDGCTCILNGEDFIRFPEIRIHDNPDAGLLIQDIHADWFDEHLEGYSD